jgi:hypothetical protein
MKEILELFIYKPKKTERIVITSLKLLFALCFTIWAYCLIGVKNITEQVVTLEKLKPFILNGHIILFLFVYYLLYQLFFYYSRYAFSLIGRISYWVMRLVYYLAFSVILDFVFSLIAWPFIKKFKFKLSVTPSINDGFFAFFYKRFKWLMHKGKIMRSKEQRMRSSKELSDVIKRMKVILIKGSDEIYNQMHTMFMFTVLFCVFYFFYIKETSQLIPIVDTIVLWACVIIGSFQIFLYWLYTNFRLIYYFYLLIYRGFHKQEVLEKELNSQMEQIALELQRNIEEAMNNAMQEPNDNPE